MSQVQELRETVEELDAAIAFIATHYNEVAIALKLSGCEISSFGALGVEMQQLPRLRDRLREILPKLEALQEIGDSVRRNLAEIMEIDKP